MSTKVLVPILLAALASMAYVVHTVTLPSGVVVTITATVSSINNTKYIIRTIAYDNTTVTDTITVIPMTGNINAVLNKAHARPVLPIGNQTQMRIRSQMMLNTTSVQGMGHGVRAMGNMTQPHQAPHMPHMGGCQNCEHVTHTTTCTAAPSGAKEEHHMHHGENMHHGEMEREEGSS